uniref:Uncharacterized protein n=1 Tax=Heterorhabditis bacteriophora TaxID=37862 RepID=A0A1I7WT06_HETBA
MGVRSLYDPRDPWAFRNTWTAGSGSLSSLAFPSSHAHFSFPSSYIAIVMMLVFAEIGVVGLIVFYSFVELWNLITNGNQSI